MTELCPKPPHYKKACRYCLEGQDIDEIEIEKVETYRRQWRATLVNNNMLNGTEPAFITANTGHRGKELAKGAANYAFTLMLSFAEL